LLTELSRTLNRPATLDDIPDGVLDELSEKGFDWVWLLSVWRTGELGKKISRENPGWRHEFEETLPDLSDDDIAGSGFAIQEYTVHPALGGKLALARIRARLKQRGLKLMLDFVPNHMAPDHPWVEEHPDYFVSGTMSDFDCQPQNYFLLQQNAKQQVMAFGRDPYFSGWPDTIQLDYGNPATQQAMIGELLQIADLCDGVRCDMAMLLVPEIFERTWGRMAENFWPKATKIVREKAPEFCFMAEVYWDMEWTLQQQGFDYTYDKRLYDRLREVNAKSVREHFFASTGYQDRMTRFLENHDEQRAASAFETNIHKAAAMITYLSPGLRFFHQGQLEGRKKRISPHLVRGPRESTDLDLQEFYAGLLEVIKQPIFRNGEWRLLEPKSAWFGNNSFDSFLAFGWEGDNGRLALVVVNYAPHTGQCYVQLPFSILTNEMVRFSDLVSASVYDRWGNEVLSKGIYFEMPEWGYHVFEVTVPALKNSEENLSGTVLLTASGNSIQPISSNTSVIIPFPGIDE